MENTEQELTKIRLELLTILHRLNKLEQKPTNYVTVKELAKIMKCSENHIYIKIREGAIKIVDVAGIRRIPLSQFVKNNETSGLVSQRVSVKQKDFMNELKKFIWE